jgi:hypothetical protein
LLIFVFEIVVRLTQFLKIDWRATSGPSAAFLLLGAWMCCFHFMYYDSLLSAVGVIALLADPGKFVRPLVVRFGTQSTANVSNAWTNYLRLRLPRSHPDLNSDDSTADSPGSGIWIANSFILYALFALIFIQATFTYLGISATFQAARFPPVNVTSRTENGTIDVIGTNGQPSMRTRQLVVVTEQTGPPWDTYCLIGIWVWSGVCTLMILAAGESQRKPAVDQFGSIVYRNSHPNP